MPAIRSRWRTSPDRAARTSESCPLTSSESRGIQKSLRHLETRHMFAAEGAQLICRDGCAGLQFNEGARRLAPFLVGLRDHRGAQYRRMPVQRLLDLQRRNILTAGDDDILRPVADLRVTVWVHHREVASVEPAPTERRLRHARLGIPQIAFHRDVTAEHDLAHRLAVPRHRLHRFRVQHRQRLLHRHPHTLPAVAFRARLSIGIMLHDACLAHTEAGPYVSVSP